MKATWIAARPQWNLSSIGGVALVPLQAPYIMSKHAVLALTECLQLEVQQAGHDHDDTATADHREGL